MKQSKGSAYFYVIKKKNEGNHNLYLSKKSIENAFIEEIKTEDIMTAIKDKKSITDILVKKIKIY